MRIEKLELNKIKVTIYPVDLDNMDLNIKNLTPDSPQLHNFLVKVMEKIEEETGFNPYTGQVMVKASPKDDCMILTVTKLYEKNAKKEPLYKGKRVRAVLKNKTKKSAIYGFECFDDLCECLVFCDDEALVDGCLYKIEGNYILSVANSNAKLHSLMKEFAIFCDPAKYCKSFLSEHAQVIAENDGLLNMAKELRKLKNL